MKHSGLKGSLEYTSGTRLFSTTTAAPMLDGIEMVAYTETHREQGSMQTRERKVTLTGKI